MEKSNQLPKTEGCLAEGEPVDLWFHRDKRPSRSVSRDKREPQVGPASCLSNSASKAAVASGDGVSVPEPKTESPATGEGLKGLPGSKSVARAEADARNRGGPESPCRTNYEGQAGRVAQRQAATPGAPGVGSAQSIQSQGASPEAGKGADKSTQPAQATSAVRTTERDWLHYALDLWFERVVRPQQQGRCRMIRYADDFVACFEYRHEAEAFEKGLKERLAKFGLEVAADKTKTLRFGHNGGPHNGRFDFLGFEFYWEPDRQGKPRVKRRTATKKWRAGVQRMTDWVKKHRHQKLGRTMKTLKAKLQGTWNYYGLIGNYRRMQLFYDATCRTLHKWLNRRSQRPSMTWPAYRRMLARFQVPRPRIVERNKLGMPCQTELSFCQRLLDFRPPRTIPRVNARAS